MNKLKLLAITSVILFIFTAINVHSQDSMDRSPEERALNASNNLKPVLNLSDIQFNQIYSSYLNFYTKIQELKESGAGTEYKEQIKDYCENIKLELNRILSEEQIKKFEAHIKNIRAIRKKT
jgi:hypothetical protein